MADDFDPYYTWLGIPPEEQPADHYRLLGVRRFESNGDVLTNAMDQRMHYLRSLQVGKRSALSQKILNEVSSAGVVLLDPQKRSEYDQQLRAKETKAAPPAAHSAHAGPTKTSRPLPVASSLPKASPRLAEAPTPSASQPASVPVVITGEKAVRDGKPLQKRSLATNPAVLGGAAFAGVAALGLIALIVVRWMQSPPTPVPPNGRTTVVGKGPLQGGTVKPDDSNKKNKAEIDVDPPTIPAVAAWWEDPQSRERLNVLEFDNRASLPIDHTANYVVLAQNTTVEGWFKLSLDRPQVMSLFGTRSGGTSGPPKGWMVTARRGVVDGKMADQLALEVWKTNNQVVRYTTSLPDPMAWHHIALVAAAGKQLQLFVDGRSVIRTPIEGELSNGGILRIGDDASARGSGLVGQVCGFRVSDTARFSQPFTPPPPLALVHDEPTVASLHFTMPVQGAVAGTVRRGVQEWKYGHGHYDEATKKVASFTPMMEWNGLQWKPGPAVPPSVGEWMSLDPLGGHTGKGQQYSVIRRWTAPEDGELAISGKLNHAHESKFGDGVRGRIVSSSAGEVGKWDSRFAEVETAIEKLAVKKGDSVDIVVECNADNHCDKFAWQLQLTLTGEGGKSLGKWDTEQDFQGPNMAGAVYRLAQLAGARWQRLDSSGNVAMLLLAPIPAAIPSSSQGPIDLISQYADGIHVMRGNVSRSGSSLVVAATATAFVLPGEMPDEYLLQAEVIREEGDESICIGLPLSGNRRVTAIVDGMKGSVSGFASVNGQQIFTPNNPLVHRGGLLTNGKPATIQVEVRTASVALLVNGTLITRWEVKPGEPVTTAKGMGFPAGRSLAVLTWKSPYRINRLQMSPLQGSAAPPPASVGRRVELVQKHGKSVQVVRGSVSHSAENGWATQASGCAFMIPESVPEEYVVEAEVVREEGSGSISFHLPVRGKALSAIIDIYDSKLTGLSDINDWNIQSRGNPTVHRGQVLTNGKPAQVRIVVSKEEISLSVDGKKLSSWPYDPQARLVGYQGLRLPDLSKLGVTTGNSKFRIPKVDLISGSGSTGSSSISAVAVGVPIELIDDTPGTIRPVQGNVQIGRNTLTMGNNRTRIVFDRVELPDEYVLQGEVTRLAGSETVGFGLTVQGRPLCVLIDAWNSNRTGICLVPGQDGERPGGSTIRIGKTLTNDTPAKFKIVVNRQEVALEINGETAARWQNDPQAQLQAFRGYEPEGRKLTLCSWFGTSYRIANLKLIPGGASPVGASPNLAGPKNPIPDAAARAKAQPQIVAVFGDELKAAKTPAAKAAVAKKISDLAKDTMDLATRYVMLEQAQRLSVEVKDIRLAMETAEAMAQDFDVPPLPAKVKLLELMSEGTLSAGQRGDLVAEGCTLGFEAIDSDQFEAAAALAAVVRTAASRATSADVKAEAKEFTDEFAQKHKRWDVVRKAENILATSPDDKAANLTLGLYYLFDRDEQAKGLAMLVKGSDPKLAAAAAARQKTVMSGVAGSVEEADAWFACLSAAPADYKGAIQKRALDACELALNSVDGLEKARLAKRRDQLKADLAAVSASATGSKRGTRVRKSDLPESAPGMIGRVFLGGKDSGVLVMFNPSPAAMDTQKLRKLLTDAKVPGGRIVLEGTLTCPTPMAMRVSHRGARATGQQVLVNGRNLSRVGGTFGEYDSERLQLPAGAHRIQWIIDFDGSIGPSMYIYEDGNGQTVPVRYNRDQNYAARKGTTTSEVDLTDGRFGN